MPLLWYILLFTFIGSVLGLAGGVVLILRPNLMRAFSHSLLTFAAGTLLGVAFLDLLPEAIDLTQGDVTRVSWYILAGLFLFFIIERFFHGHMHADADIDAPLGKTTGGLVTVGDTIHNFIDGVAIAASFLVSVPLGIVTSISVFLHEIPQEVGDFSVMLNAGFSRKRVVLLNIFSALASFAGALITFAIGASLQDALGPLLAVTAGMFIYIVGSDIIPEIHRRREIRHLLADTSLLALGALAMGSLAALLPA